MRVPWEVGKRVLHVTDLVHIQVFELDVREFLASDRVLQELWRNNGKPNNSDTSNSGYDYTIACLLAQQERPPEDIAMVLALQPTGAEERARKGVDYLFGQSRTPTQSTSE
jgi:hypothetical protein